MKINPLVKIANLFTEECLLFGVFCCAVVFRGTLSADVFPNSH